MIREDMNSDVLKLDTQEEIDLLSQIYEGDYLGCGSSRATFQILWEGKPAVAKVFLDFAGYYQSIRNELELYRRHEKEGAPLAKIYAYGHNCIIAEEVSVGSDTSDEWLYSVEILVESEANYYKQYVEYCEANDYEVEFTESQYYEVREVLEFLEGELGNTGDNYQIGLNAQGKFVCYDYGYERGVSKQQQVGQMDECIYDYGVSAVLDAAIDMVRNEEDFSYYPKCFDDNR